MNEVISMSELTCPVCGDKENLEMPTDACQWFHKCVGCDSLLKPKEGDCCVFCSYGSVPCPPIQQEKTGQLIGECGCGKNK